jgi:hypothetical protein
MHSSAQSATLFEAAIPCFDHLGTIVDLEADAPAVPQPSPVPTVGTLHINHNSNVYHVPCGPGLPYCEVRRHDVEIRFRLVLGRSFCAHAPRGRAVSRHQTFLTRGSVAGATGRPGQEHTSSVLAPVMDSMVCNLRRNLVER